jgi:hypothetical protein
MNKADIDDISTFVNSMNMNCDTPNNTQHDLQEVLKSLPQRIPAFKDIHQNQRSQNNEQLSIKKSLINRPTDPDMSASSGSDNENGTSLARRHADNSKKSYRMNRDKQKYSSDNKKHDKKVRIEIPDDNEQAEAASEHDQNNNSVDDNNKICNDYQKTHLTSLFGYSIPISTIYFIIILVVIAIALYFLTAERKRENKDKDKKKESD